MTAGGEALERSEIGLFAHGSAMAGGGLPGTTRRMLNSREKAAVVVRWLLSQGGRLPIAQLSEQSQTLLAEQMARMRLVDRETLELVMAEFSATLEGVGLAFPGGLEGALSAMDGHISQTAASRLRRKAGARGDPWERLVTLSPDRLLPILESEATEVAAVILSKLPVARAAEILGRLPGATARRIAFAVSLTANVDPETVRRIGQAILAQIDAQPPRAFERAPVDRVGAILDVSAAATREDVLKGLEEEDAEFAERVRKAIFTYAHIPLRVLPRDVPRILRATDQPGLITAMTWSIGRPEEPATEFLLANMSQRMAQTLREEISTRGKIRDKDGEAAVQMVVNAIRGLETAGDLVLQQEEEAQ